jgi:glycerate kinase
MRFLIAPDKFKGTLTGQEAAEIMGQAIISAYPGAVLDLCPIADGGEGTAAILAAQLGAERHMVETIDALGRTVEAEYFRNESEAYLDMAAASGLWRVAPVERAPLRSSTYGTGVQLWHLIENGIQQIHIGLGGSATVDAGCGTAAALGYRFTDSAGAVVEPLPVRFPEIVGVRPPSLRSAPLRTHRSLESEGGPPRTTPFPEVIGLIDVETRLLGPEGATYTYGPQKGLQSREVAWLDKELSALVRRLSPVLGDHSETPGSGAAGGYGFGILTFLQGRLVPGFDFIAEKVKLADRISLADVVLTGEGKLDRQSLQGKGPYGLARLAAKAGKPVWAIAGVVEDEPLLRSHFTRIVSLAGGEVSTETAMKHPAEILARRVSELTGGVE